MDLTDIFRAFHHKAAENTFFQVHTKTFSRIHHILGHETNLNKLKKFEIISSIFSDCYDIKVEVNHKKITEKHTST